MTISKIYVIIKHKERRMVMTDIQVIIFFIVCVLFAIVVWQRLGMFDNIIYKIKHILKRSKYLM